MAHPTSWWLTISTHLDTRSTRWKNTLNFIVIINFCSDSHTLIQRVLRYYLNSTKLGCFFQILREFLLGWWEFWQGVREKSNKWLNVTDSDLERGSCYLCLCLCASCPAIITKLFSYRRLFLTKILQTWIDWFQYCCYWPGFCSNISNCHSD